MNVPNNFNYCDHLIDQMPPTSAWGREFVTMPLASRQGGDTFRFLASANDTRVTVNGQLLATLQRGEFHEEIIDVPMRIISNQPILVVQYSNGNAFDLDENPNGDPFMMLIPPFEQFLGGYTLTTPSEGFSENFINVVVATNAVGTVFLDGARIPSGTFSPIGDSGFSGARVPIALGTHNLSGSSPFGAFIYGFGDDDSYGYPGGQSLSPVAMAEDLGFTTDLSPSTVGQQLCVRARVTDNASLPLQGIRADFTVTGANPTSGFVFSNAAGICEFCYTGTNLGTDTIRVAIGSLEDTTTVDWVVGADDSCVEGPETLCLGRNGRFRIQVRWQDSDGNGGLARAESIGKRDSGLFYFFNSNNIEMFIKVLDACDLGNFNNFWVFYAATTNVEFTVSVTDTVAGEVKEYFNPLGTAALPIQDVEAFQTCP